MAKNKVAPFFRTRCTIISTHCLHRPCLCNICNRERK